MFRFPPFLKIYSCQNSNKVFFVFLCIVCNHNFYQSSKLCSNLHLSLCKLAIANIEMFSDIFCSHIWNNKVLMRAIFGRPVLTKACQPNFLFSACSILWLKLLELQRKNAVIMCCRKDLQHVYLSPLYARSGWDKQVY